MNNIFEENRNAFLMLSGLLFVLLIVLYFAFISPLLSDLKDERANHIDLQNEIAVLEKQIQQIDETQEELTQEQLELQKKVPLTRELEEIVLILQDIELQSSSLIELIDFYYDSSLPTPDFSHELDADEVIEGANDAEGEENSDKESQTIELKEKPESLQVITISMEITSPSYDDFLQLIKEIEQQERIMSVSKLQFEKTSDFTVKDEQDELITHKVELMTFYYKE